MTKFTVRRPNPDTKSFEFVAERGAASYRLHLTKDGMKPVDDVGDDTWLQILDGVEVWLDQDGNQGLVRVVPAVAKE